jgi:hypothetical protein
MSQASNDAAWNERRFTEDKDTSTSPSDATVARKADGSQDGPATLARHRELDPTRFERTLGVSSSQPSQDSGPQRTRLEERQDDIDAEWYKNRFTGTQERDRRPIEEEGGAPVVTKADGSQDGPATVAAHSEGKHMPGGLEAVDATT